jgi:hypothetical protein
MPFGDVLRASRDTPDLTNPPANLADAVPAPATAPGEAPTRRLNPRQIARMVLLGKNFHQTIKSLPLERQQHYASEHRAVIDAKNRANSDPDILGQQVD